MKLNRYEFCKIILNSLATRRKTNYSEIKSVRINFNRPLSASCLILSGLESRVPSFAISLNLSSKVLPSCNAPIKASSMILRRSWMLERKFFTASISIGNNVSLHAVSRAFILSRHSSARLEGTKVHCFYSRKSSVKNFLEYQS